MKITDTHCHLNDPSFQDRIEDVLKRGEDAGLSDYIVPAYDMESLQITAILSERYDCIHPAYGIHPWYITENSDLKDVEYYLEQKKTVAVGEIGLDYAEDVTTPRDVQIKYFLAQIELAISFNLPVLIHCRRAHSDMLKLLRPYSGKLSGIMHSFSGTGEIMREFLGLGFYISFSGAITKSYARKYHKNAMAIPIDRILFETDAPSISTQSVEAKNVEPCHIIEIIKKVANLRGTSFENLVNASILNVKRLFGEKIGRE